MCTYFFVYYIGFTDAKFNRQMVKNSAIFGSIFILSVEGWNLGIGTTYMVADLISEFPFMKDKDPIYQFLFLISWVFPLIISVNYLILWLFPPVYNINSNKKLRKTWFEKLCSKLKK